MALLRFFILLKSHFKFKTVVTFDRRRQSRRLILHLPMQSVNQCMSLHSLNELAIYAVCLS